MPESLRSSHARRTDRAPGGWCSRPGSMAALCGRGRALRDPQRAQPDDAIGLLKDADPAVHAPAGDKTHAGVVASPAAGRGAHQFEVAVVIDWERLACIARRHSTCSTAEVGLAYGAQPHDRQKT